MLETKKQVPDCYIISFLMCSYEYWAVFLRMDMGLEVAVMWVYRRMLEISRVVRVSNDGVFFLGKMNPERTDI